MQTTKAFGSSQIMIERREVKKENKFTTRPSIAFISRFAGGKTYYSNLLQKELKALGIKTFRVSLAQKIKDVAFDVFGMKEKNRRLLQQLGAKMRDIDPNVWIKYLITNIKNENKLPFIIDDLRFLNEASIFKENFNPFYIIKINSDSSKRFEIYKTLYGRYPTEEEINDPTETEIDEIKADDTIINEYDPSMARNTIKIIIDKYFK